MSDVDALNRKVKEWAQTQEFRALANINSLGVINTGRLFSELHNKLGYKSGMVDRVSFKFPRYGIMVEKGVGKGRGIRSGKTNPRPWLSRALDEAAISELADIVASESANMAVNATRLIK